MKAICIFLICSLSFYQLTESCYSACNGCTCQGTCEYPQNCWGTGPDCYCGSRATSLEDYLSMTFHEQICRTLEDVKMNITIPIYQADQYNMNGQIVGTFKITCVHGLVCAIL